MDKPTLDTLQELTGDGTQTILGAGQSVTGVNYYRLDIISDCVFEAMYIMGDAANGLNNVSIKSPYSLHNVTGFNVTSGVCIGYTAPSLTGNIE
tara:strand:+ start:3633 stop:3914 length:282 start_codon:yes stop_codon:yes gene_type:complete